MGSLVQRNKVVAKRKGVVAAAAAGGTVALAIASPFLGVVGLIGASYLAWEWFSFRVKNGMRF